MMLTAKVKTSGIQCPVYFSGAGKHHGLAGRVLSGFYRPSGTGRRELIRAVVSGGDDSKSSTEIVEKLVDSNGPLVSSDSSSGSIKVKAVITVRKKLNESLFHKIEDEWESFMCGIGRGISLQLVSEDVDPATMSGKTVESFVKGWVPKLSENHHAHEYNADFTVPRDFGQPGAILVTNWQDKEFYLTDIVVHGFSEDPIFFWADTYIHSKKDNPESRIIFKNHAYLPSQTPAGIKDLRREDLLSLRGNGKGERKLHERIYDYDDYNDLGNPESEELTRPVLGTKERPYPRRCRTGREPTETDPNTETRIEKPGQVYVPRDETFEETKQKSFSAGRLRAVFHNLIPMIASKLSTSDISFTNFADIDNLYKDGILLKDEEQKEVNWKLLVSNVMNQMSGVGEKWLKYDLPAIVKHDRFSWIRDNEFARQTLAGVNPVDIQLLKELPILSKLDPAKYGSPDSAITKELIQKQLNGIDIEEAIKDKKLFILDYHDILLPFIDEINALPGRKAYASRTVFHYSDNGVLRPIIIELSLPPTPSSSNKYVFTDGHYATTHWIWKLAKAHACSNDTAVHQLVNHWLRTHASMEPYVIASNRQLSSMHPVYKLLNPHMRYTMEINALARQNLINGGGVIESVFSAGRYSMEISSAAYKSLWRFDMEALPADLIRRGMGVEDLSVPGGVKLVIEDYPYAADGLLIWSAIKELVESYVAHYYSEPNCITLDVELQAWWDEIKNKGHQDKKDEPWWPELKTQDDLAGILSTMIWVASGQHAAINFGQYPFGGYPPNRPTLMRKLIPIEGDPNYATFLQSPEYTFMTSLPTQLQATKTMAVQDALSTHSPDEEYIHQLHNIQRQWFNDPEVHKLFENFSVKLEEVERIINQRNTDNHLKNRTGAGVPPYELLLPSSAPGVTGRGIPNSISI